MLKKYMGAIFGAALIFISGAGYAQTQTEIDQKATIDRSLLDIDIGTVIENSQFFKQKVKNWNFQPTAGVHYYLNDNLYLKINMELLKKLEYGMIYGAGYKSELHNFAYEVEIDYNVDHSVNGSQSKVSTLDYMGKIGYEFNSVTPYFEIKNIFKKSEKYDAGVEVPLNSSAHVTLNVEFNKTFDEFTPSISIGYAI